MRYLVVFYIVRRQHTKRCGLETVGYLVPGWLVAVRGLLFVVAVRGLLFVVGVRSFVCLFPSATIVKPKRPMKVNVPFDECNLDCTNLFPRVSFTMGLPSPSSSRRGLAKQNSFSSFIEFVTKQ
jgi:hypothetical protein